MKSEINIAIRKETAKEPWNQLRWHLSGQDAAKTSHKGRIRHHMPPQGAYMYDIHVPARQTITEAPLRSGRGILLTT